MNVPHFIQKNAWALFSALYAILIACFADTPVFGDMYGQVKTAHYFLETHFNDLLPNRNGFTDNGHFPLYTLYLAGLFKLLGFHLWVAHFSVLPFVIGLFYQLQHFCKKYLSDVKTILALSLVAVNPALLSQSIYFSSEVCLVFGSIWLLNTIIDERTSRIVLSSTLLCLLNLRALPFVFLLCIYFFLMKKKRIALYLLFSVLVSIIWLITHFYLCGWVLKNNENMQHRSVLNFPQMLKNIFLYSFHLLNCGNIIALLIVAKNAFYQKKINKPFVFVLLFAAGIFLFSIPLSNPINTKYFLTAYILLVPAFIEVTNKKNIFVLLLYIVFMWQTQFVKTPERYGYSWDCNTQSLAYFEVRKQLDDYVAENNISPKKIEAGYQLYFNDDFYLMNNSHKEYTLLSDTEMPVNTYVAQSNIPNNYNADREEYLKKNYTLVKTFTKAWVYIDLYKKR